MTDFDKALTFSLSCEGGYSDDPKDPGGETNFGISKRAYQHLDIKALTREDAANVYRADYWVGGGCDKLPFPVNIAHFDCCVNVGNVTLRAAGPERHLRANRILQRAASVLDDGIIGPATLRAVASKDALMLAVACVDERDEYYRRLVVEKPTFARYLNGWLNRTQSLRRLF